MNDAQFEVFVSDHLHTEFTNTISNEFFTRLLGAEGPRLLGRAMRLARDIDLTRTVGAVASHPEDDLVLATALSCDADLLVTGDKQLLKLGRVEGVRIVDSRAFLEMLDEKD